MRTLTALVKRNSKLFFKDKGMFFTSLITPAILLVLYATFLANVYKSSFMSSLPKGLEVAEKLIDGVVGAQLISSLLAVSCVTVSFCSNMLMVQDKVNGSLKDLRMSPVKNWTLAFGYYVTTLVSTIIICVVAMALCLTYIYFVGWYLTVTDILLILGDIFLLTMFGTALSSIIHFFLSSQGQISAVGTIVSSGYGFICGAYMPISQFSEGLQNVIMFFPGTYGTSLLRNHAMRGTFAEMEKINFPSEIIEAIKDSIDCNIYFFGEKVPIGIMYAVIGVTIAALVGIYILINVVSGRSKKKQNN